MHVEKRLLGLVAAPAAAAPIAASAQTPPVAGMEAGDVLASVAEIEVQNASFGDAFRVRYADEPLGTSYTLVVDRGGKRLELDAERSGLLSGTTGS